MRQVLPVVGAAIGAYFGGAQGAQWGWAIGSMIGNAVDPQVIKGPSIGDLGQQTSQEGGPRPIFFGLSQPVAGNIIACSKPKIVTKKQRTGKGGGPVQETQSVYRTYAIGIGESINNLVRAWRNGKLVYDARPQGDPSNNALFLAQTRIFTGSFDQMPSADLEAQFGAGNVPAMRGTAYIVRPNEDLTSQQGAVPQWMFQVIRCEGTVYTSQPYPLDVTDALAMSPTGQSGDMHPTYLPYSIQPEAMSMSLVPQGGELKSHVISYPDWPPEAIALTLTPQDGELKNHVISYPDWPPEAIALTLTPQAGELKQILIQYTNWPAEALELTITPQGGELA